MSIHSLTIAKTSRVLGIANIVAIAALALSLWLSSFAQGELVDAQEKQYVSYLLADELRQSSDDLTRLARTYVITGATKYERQYFDILDIRNGKKPRPAEYHRIYWDFIAADLPQPRPDTETIALLDLMEQAGFSEAEFAFLTQAQANSDGLVNIEVQAMNAVKGKFADQSGNYTVNRAPDFELARELMHSPQYHTFKADIMVPVDAFFVALAERTGGAIAKAENKANLYTLLSVVALLTLVAISAGTFWVLSKRVIQPILHMKTSMLRLSKGDVAEISASLKTQDEIGDMARALGIFQENASERIKLEAAQEEARQAAALRTDLVDKLVSSFDSEVIESLSRMEGATTSMQDCSDQLNQTSETTARSVTTVSGAAEEASSNVQTMAAAAEELSSSIAEIGGQAEHSTKIVAAASQRSHDTNVKVTDLATAAERIGDVVDLIQDIAEQTNLLALNATIEAARAGEAGKGFAVVASEVKSLATQTAKATEEIGQQIRHIQGSTSETVDAIQEVTKIFEDVTGISTAIAAAIAEQNAATAEISRSAQKASEGTSQVSESIGTVSSATDESKGVTQKVVGATTQLVDESHNLKMIVDRFLAEVKVA